MSTSRLQTAPLGLLGALGLKVGGENPDEFQKSLQPQLNALPFYLVGRTAIARGQTFNFAPDQTSEAFISPVLGGQMWRVLAVSAYPNVAAGDAAVDSQTSMFFEDQLGQRVTIANGSAVTASISSDARAFGVLLPEPFLLPPSWRIGARSVLITAPASDWTLFVDVLLQAIET